MIRFFTRFWAKWNYVFQLEFESAKSDLNADLAKRNANEKRISSRSRRGNTHLLYAHHIEGTDQAVIRSRFQFILISILTSSMHCGGSNSDYW
jgi:hypothetical protein